MTTLSRLADKGALGQTRDAVDGAVTPTRMRRLLSNGAGRAGVLTRFVEDPSADDPAGAADWRPL